jgi:hypothetical protein
MKLLLSLYKMSKFKLWYIKKKFYDFHSYKIIVVGPTIYFEKLIRIHFSLFFEVNLLQTLKHIVEGECFKLIQLVIDK